MACLYELLNYFYLKLINILQALITIKNNKTNYLNMVFTIQKTILVFTESIKDLCKKLKQK